MPSPSLNAKMPERCRAAYRTETLIDGWLRVGSIRRKMRVFGSYSALNGHPFYYLLLSAILSDPAKHSLYIAVIHRAASTSRFHSLRI